MQKKIVKEIEEKAMTPEEFWQLTLAAIRELLQDSSLPDPGMPMIKYYKPEVAKAFNLTMPFYHYGDNTIAYSDKLDVQQLVHEMTHAFVLQTNIHLEDWQVELVPRMVAERI